MRVVWNVAIGIWIGSALSAVAEDNNTQEQVHIWTYQESAGLVRLPNQGNCYRDWHFMNIECLSVKNVLVQPCLDALDERCGNPFGQVGMFPKIEDLLIQNSIEP